MEFRQVLASVLYCKYRAITVASLYAAFWSVTYFFAIIELIVP